MCYPLACSVGNTAQKMECKVAREIGSVGPWGSENSQHRFWILTGCLYQGGHPRNKEVLLFRQMLSS